MQMWRKSKFSGSNVTLYDAIRGLTTIMVSSQLQYKTFHSKKKGIANVAFTFQI